jgi:hypothetical protein
MTRTRFCLVAALLFVPTSLLTAREEAPPTPELAKVRETRVRLNEKGNASEFAGNWRMTLPAGFEYNVTLKQEENGLLRMTCAGHALNLLGDFSCVGNELRLVEARKERVDDCIWVYRDGKFVLVLEEHGHGANYRGATLKRLP